MGTRLVALALAASALAWPAATDAASLRLRDGSTLLVSPAPPSLGARASSAAEGRPPLVGMTFLPDGSTRGGVVPGSAGASIADVALGQNPVTGEIALVFARPTAGGGDLAASGWTGQAWTEPTALTQTTADDRHPVLSYRANGEALLAWVAGGPSPTLLLRHFDLAPGLEPRTFTFAEVGDPALILASLAQPVAGEARLVHVVPSPEALAAYLLLGSADGAPAGVVRVELDAIVDPGGFGAAPVPVNFIRSTTQSAGSTSPLDGPRGGGATGQVFEPWRIVVGSDEAWYWAEGSRGLLVPVRHGVAGAAVGFDVPQQEELLHVAAYRVARSELGFGLRRAASGEPGSRRLR